VAELGRTRASDQGMPGRLPRDRFAIYDIENHAGTPVYVHAKVVVVDDVWAMIGFGQSQTGIRERMTARCPAPCLTRAWTSAKQRDPRGDKRSGRVVFARDVRLAIVGASISTSTRAPVRR